MHLIKQKTGGVIIAKIAEYTGPILSKTDDDNIFAWQTELGDISNSVFAYELFITSIAAPNYKYRVMIIHYAIDLYPVTIVLDESIAVEFSNKQELKCKSYDEFILYLKIILNSRRLKKVISALLALANDNVRPLASNG